MNQAPPRRHVVSRRAQDIVELVLIYLLLMTVAIYPAPFRSFAAGISTDFADTFVLGLIYALVILSLMRAYHLWKTRRSVDRS